MKVVTAIVLMIMFSTQVLAQAQFSLQPRLSGNKAPSALLGIWGTARQCAAHKSGKTDDPLLFPYIITHDWIKQGFIYCFLAWYEPTRSVGNNQAFAFAQCGEDQLRDYQLELNLREGKLSIRWSDDFTTRELEACE